MAFGAAVYTEHPQERAPSGAYRDAAVKCWFTASGRSMPLMLKVKDDRGEIIQIGPIQVITCEKQNFAGISAWRYECQASLEGRRIAFTLLFFPERCCWQVVMRTGKTMGRQE